MGAIVFAAALRFCPRLRVRLLASGAVLGLALGLWSLAPNEALGQTPSPALWPVLLSPTPPPLPPPPAAWSRAAWLDRLHVEKWRQIPPAGAQAALSQWQSSHPVLLWAQWAREPIAAFDRLDPPRAARALAYSSVATYEALRLVDASAVRHPRPGPAANPSYPDALAAVCAAQSRVLGACFPDWASGLARRAEALAWLNVAAGSAYPSDVQAGWQAGHAAAAIAIARLTQDPHATASPPAAWALSPEAGTWQTWLKHPPTVSPPPTRANGAKEPAQQKMRPLDIRRRNLVMKWLRRDLASLWLARVADLCAQYHLGPLHAAYVLAATTMAMHDATLCAWREQAVFQRARPRVEKNMGLLPLPDHSVYPSDTAAIAFAAAEMTAQFFPRQRALLLREAKEAAEAAQDAGWCDAWDSQAGETLGRCVTQRLNAQLQSNGASKLRF